MLIIQTYDITLIIRIASLILKKIHCFSYRLYTDRESILKSKPFWEGKSKSGHFNQNALANNDCKLEH